MDFYEAVKNRRSIRKFNPDPIPREVLGNILEAARSAPSWKNMQCWRFILVEDAEIRGRLAEALKGKNPCAAGIEQAPVTLVVCAVPSESGLPSEEDGKQYYMTDCGIVFAHIMLAATAEGLGSCFVGWYGQSEIQEILGVPAEIPVVGFTPLGYPAHEPKDRGRKPMDELLYKNTWGE